LLQIVSVVVLVYAGQFLSLSLSFLFQFLAITLFLPFSKHR